MTRFDLRLGTTVGFVLVALAAACSAAPVGGDTLGGDQSGVAGTKKGSTSSSSGADPGASSSGSTSSSSSSGSTSSSGGSTSSSSSGGTGACTSSATADACYDCCITAHESGFNAAEQAFGDCACQTPGVCKTQCSTTYCAGQQPSAACETCLNAATQCNTAADTACSANADCQALDACIASSSCDSKP